jgi:hypothetical protein
MKIIIGIVSRGNDINSFLVKFISLISKDCKHDYSVIINKSPHSAQKGQEALFKSLESIDFDYAFITDSDVSCDIDTIDKLMEAKKDVVVAPVWHYDESSDDVHLNIHRVGFENDGLNSRVYYPRESGVEQIISSSFACMLLSKRVFNTFKEFNKSYTEENSQRQSDNVFFNNLSTLGIGAWVRWDIKTVHHRMVSLSTLLVDKLLLNGIRDKYINYL